MRIPLFSFTMIALTFACSQESENQAQLQSTATTRTAERSADSCAGPLQSVAVSADGKNFSRYAKVAQSALRYYFRVNKKCKMSFIALIAGREVEWKSTSWGTYFTNSQGMARIDFTTAEVPPGIYKARFKNSRYKNDSSVAWSPEITVEIVNQTQNAANVINFRDYWVDDPGLVWIYETDNKRTGKKGGLTRLQIESERMWCGVKVRPWRYTKNDIHAYWSPALGYPFVNSDGSRDRGLAPVPGSRADQSLRWMIAAPSHIMNTAYDNFVWAVGHKTYRRVAADAFSEIHDSNIGISYLYTGKLPNLPAYNLGSLKTTLPHSAVGMGTSHYQGLPNNETSCGPLVNPNISTASEGNHSWRMRVERHPLSLPGLGSLPDTIRVDYFEGHQNMDSDYQLRESWYFSKGIGVVKVESMTRNHPFLRQELDTSYANAASMKDKNRSCLEGMGCAHDQIEEPDAVVTLKHYFKNAPLAISVSSDGKTFSSETCSTNKTYYLDVRDAKTKFPYTGFLEFRTDHNGRIGAWKWTNRSGKADGWVQNGRIKVDLPMNFPEGVTQARFRVLVPTEMFNGETPAPGAKITDFSVFSNPITVKLQRNCP